MSAVVWPGLTVTGTALADSTPVGPLPRPAVTTVTTAKGSLVAVGLPSARPGRGLSGGSRDRSTRRVGEAEVGGGAGSSAVVVLRVEDVGRASRHFALARGDASRKALRAVRYDVRAT